MLKNARTHDYNDYVVHVVLTPILLLYSVSTSFAPTLEHHTEQHNWYSTSRVAPRYLVPSLLYLHYFHWRTQRVSKSRLFNVKYLSHNGQPNVSWAICDLRVDHRSSCVTGLPP